MGLDSLFLHYRPEKSFMCPWLGLLETILGAATPNPTTNGRYQKQRPDPCEVGFKPNSCSLWNQFHHWASILDNTWPEKFWVQVEKHITLFQQEEADTNTTKLAALSCELWGPLTLGVWLKRSLMAVLPHFPVVWSKMKHVSTGSPWFIWCKPTILTHVGTWQSPKGATNQHLGANEALKKSRSSYRTWGCSDV